ncbi:porin [Methylobacterium sp. CB376]|uniref:porin n=1 Tax=unclassified Methylobacterium TaxID=2615210 RepID=UPI0003237A9B|nr:MULTISPECIES: porin [Methylobacterium]WFT77162.1 porin [Methylobacterium nodulans]
MVRMRSLLPASAAALTGVAGASAADLPVRKAAPVEYVRVCTAHGVGFFTVPGTDTCIRIGGRARFEATVIQPLMRSGGDTVGYRGLGRLNLDARTSTGYGTLRAFVRFDLASRTGGYLKAPTVERFGWAFSATGVDTAGRVQQFVNVDKAFIQFAGLTAGRAASFYDFYGGDFEIIGNALGSGLASTNLLAYTATLGQGVTATLSVEDSNFRKTPLFGGGAAGTFAGGPSAASGSFAPLVVTDAAGAPVAVASLDTVQRSRMPDVVGVLRYDGSWGAAQLSAAVHELNAGNPVLGAAGGPALTVLTPAQAAALPRAAAPAGRAASAYGWAIQGGVKISLPFLAAGDALYLQGAYGEGAERYVGVANYNGALTPSSFPVPGLFSSSYADAVVDPLTGRMTPSTSFSAVASLLHYWVPEWRSAVFASYGEMQFGKGVRAGSALFGVGGLPNPTSAAGAAALAISPVLRDTTELVTGASLIWSPVRDLDVGVEGVYVRTAVASGRVLNPNKSVLNLAAAGLAGGPTLAQVQAAPTVASQDTFQVRMRVQRDF